MNTKVRTLHRYALLPIGISLLTSAWTTQSIAQREQRMPKVIVTPNYPELARRARVWGEVKCRILIDEHGKVEKCTEVIGHPLLRDAAKKVVSEWSFSPGMKSETTIQFRFDFVNWAQECGNTQAKIELPDKVYIYTTYVPLQTSFQPPQ